MIYIPEEDDDIYYDMPLDEDFEEDHNNGAIYYHCQVVAIAPCFEEHVDSNTRIVHGVQSVGINTIFETIAFKELSQVPIYEHVEETPSFEITIEKLIDGHPSIYHLCTKPQPQPTFWNPNKQELDYHSFRLRNRIKSPCCIALGFYRDDREVVSGGALTEVYISGCYITNITYDFDAETRLCKESVTLIGFHKEWNEKNPKMLNKNITSQIPRSPRVGDDKTLVGEDSPAQTNNDGIDYSRPCGGEFEFSPQKMSYSILKDPGRINLSERSPTNYVVFNEEDYTSIGSVGLLLSEHLNMRNSIFPRDLDGINVMRHMEQIIDDDDFTKYKFDPYSYLAGNNANDKDYSIYTDNLSYIGRDYDWERKTLAYYQNAGSPDVNITPEYTYENEDEWINNICFYDPKMISAISDPQERFEICSGKAFYTQERFENGWVTPLLRGSDFIKYYPDLVDTRDGTRIQINGCTIDISLNKNIIDELGSKKHYHIHDNDITITTVFDTYLNPVQDKIQKTTDIFISGIANGTWGSPGSILYEKDIVSTIESEIKDKALYEYSDRYYGEPNKEPIRMNFINGQTYDLGSSNLLLSIESTYESEDVYGLKSYVYQNKDADFILCDPADPYAIKEDHCSSKRKDLTVRVPNFMLVDDFYSISGWKTTESVKKFVLLPEEEWYEFQSGVVPIDSGVFACPSGFIKVFPASLKGNAGMCIPADGVEYYIPSGYQASGYYIPSGEILDLGLPQSLMEDYMIKSILDEFTFGKFIEETKGYHDDLSNPYSSGTYDTINPTLYYNANNVNVYERDLPEPLVRLISEIESGTLKSVWFRTENSGEFIKYENMLAEGMRNILCECVYKGLLAPFQYEAAFQCQQIQVTDDYEYRIISTSKTAPCGMINPFIDQSEIDCTTLYFPTYSPSSSQRARYIDFVIPSFIKDKQQIGLCIEITRNGHAPQKYYTTTGSNEQETNKICTPISKFPSAWSRVDNLLERDPLWLSEGIMQANEICDCEDKGCSRHNYTWNGSFFTDSLLKQGIELNLLSQKEEQDILNDKNECLYYYDIDLERDPVCLDTNLLGDPMWSIFSTYSKWYLDNINRLDGYGESMLGPLHNYKDYEIIVESWNYLPVEGCPSPSMVGNPEPFTGCSQTPLHNPQKKINLYFHSFETISEYEGFYTNLDCSGPDEENPKACLQYIQESIDFTNEYDGEVVGEDRDGNPITINLEEIPEADLRFNVGYFLATYQGAFHFGIFNSESLLDLRDDSHLNFVQINMQQTVLGLSSPTAKESQLTNYNFCQWNGSTCAFGPDPPRDAWPSIEIPWYCSLRSDTPDENGYLKCLECLSPGYQKGIEFNSLNDQCYRTVEFYPMIQENCKVPEGSHMSDKDYLLNDDLRRIPPQQWTQEQKTRFKNIQSLYKPVKPFTALEHRVYNVENFYQTDFLISRPIDTRLIGVSHDDPSFSDEDKKLLLSYEKTNDNITRMLHNNFNLENSRSPQDFYEFYDSHYFKFREMLEIKYEIPKFFYSNFAPVAFDADRGGIGDSVWTQAWSQSDYDN